MKDKTVKQWTKELAAKDGKYGGGSAASVVGAIATNLAQYVFELQQGKKKYEVNEAQIQQAINRAKALNEELLDLAEIDADVFDPVIALFKLPKDTEDERIYRRGKIDQGLADAAQPPLAIMKKMAEVMDLFDELITLEVSGSILDDIAVGAIFVRAVIESSKLNCDSNTKSIHDEQLRVELAAEVDENFQALMVRSQQLKEVAMNKIKNN